MEEFAARFCVSMCEVVRTFLAAARDLRSWKPNGLFRFRPERIFKQKRQKLLRDGGFVIHFLAAHWMTKPQLPRMKQKSLDSYLAFFDP